jgi:hypothetical protein
MLLDGKKALVNAIARKKMDVSVFGVLYRVAVNVQLKRVMQRYDSYGI